MENQGTQNPQNGNQQFQQPFGQPFGQQQLPNATAVLVLGIISIVGCFLLRNNWISIGNNCNCFIKQSG